jgi:bifunctional UDP-N-acetylglucosamine pyrophosphorylase/glucosamine-1-phosphate N-acetyltransferase/UDP-N-acetylglucosamine pyrophosphorylase
MCAQALRDFQGPVVVLAGDSPLTQPESIRRLLEAYGQHRPACVVGTLEKHDPQGLGRILRDSQGEFQGIVEEKDATPQQRAIREVNMSTYIFDCQELLATLDLLQNNNRQEEYYITDAPGLLRARGRKVLAIKALQPCEALSINNMQELALVEAEMRRMGYAGCGDRRV